MAFPGKKGDLRIIISMGLTIILEDEHGNCLQALPTEFDYSELGKIDLENYSLLKYIDFFGDSTFNYLQLNDLQNDFEKLKSASTSQKQIIQDIIDLIERSRKNVHSYIKFYGD